eukprot:gi/632956705/ref/XP_007894091.1/ PREDICTED: suppressor of tumorigenicity 14 protein homolog [Callorhinchus milii]
MWMLIAVFVAAFLLTFIFIVFAGIRASSRDDDFVDPKLKVYGTARYYTGTMTISSLSFTPELMMPQTETFSSLSSELKKMLLDLYGSSPALGYYFVDSNIFSFRYMLLEPTKCQSKVLVLIMIEDIHNGSVIVYYWLQFALPKEPDFLIKYTLSPEVLINVLRQHLSSDGVAQHQALVIEPHSLTLDVADQRYVESLKSGHCAFYVPVLNNEAEQNFSSLKLDNCGTNTSHYWRVQGHSGHSIKAILSVRSEACGMDVTTYYGWFPDSKRDVSKFRQVGVPHISEVIASETVFLMTITPTRECDLPQYSITFSQVPMTECGGVLSGINGSFVSPSYPNFNSAEINCTWTLKVPDHFSIVVFFKDLAEAGASFASNHIEVDGRRFSEHKQFFLYSKSSSLQIRFHSNETYTSGFAVDYLATDVCTDPSCNEIMCSLAHKTCQDLKECNRFNDVTVYDDFVRTITC